MNKLECVAVDLDGSLLNDNKEVSPQDLATIHRLKEQGVYVFINTGRHFPFAKMILNQVGDDLPGSYCNGAYVYDSRADKILSEQLIPPHLVVGIKEFFDKRQIPYMIYTRGGAFFDNDKNPRYPYWCQLSAQLAPEDRFPIMFLEDIDISQQSVYKFLACYEAEDLLALFEKEFEFTPQLYLTTSYKALCDVNRAGVHKGSGLAWLANHYGFDLKNTLAMGDNHNDIPMLSLVGYPVVPQNGEDDVKPLARFVTTNCNDAPLTHAIRHFFPELL